MKIFCYSLADIKNLMAGRAYKKPFNEAILPLEHGVKTILIATCGADLKLILHCHIYNFVIHTCLLAFLNSPTLSLKREALRFHKKEKLPLIISLCIKNSQKRNPIVALAGQYLCL